MQIDQENNTLLSLCIPTNGIIEWVIPVLDSIYSQKANENAFEVIVTDNGANSEFSIKIKAYQSKHKNLFYYKTNAFSFLNEIEAYKKANGLFIKFINHRSKLKPGVVNYLIDFVRKNKDDKPFIYFSYGSLNWKGKTKSFSTFDKFVLNLSFYSSCSSGMAFWKEDFDSLPPKIEYNTLFPHTTILFSKPFESNYLIDDMPLFNEIQPQKRPKGKYDLFYAFAVEYPSIILNLRRKNLISIDTFNLLKKKIAFFNGGLYFKYCIQRKYCSYDLSSFRSSTSVYFTPCQIKRAAYKFAFTRLINKL